MAINPVNSAAALAAGAVVALGASMPAVQQVSPIAPGILGAAVGLGALALAKNGPVSAAGFAALGVGGVLLWQGIQAMMAEKKAASAGAPAQQAAGLATIQNPFHQHVLPAQTNLGLRQSIAAPQGFGNLKPSTAQGMTGQRFVRAWNTMSPGVGSHGGW